MTEQNISQALRATIPHNLATTKEFVHAVQESETLTDSTGEPGVQSKELEDSQFHKASQEANMVIEGGGVSPHDAHVWDFTVKIALTKLLHLALPSQHKTWKVCCKISRVSATGLDVGYPRLRTNHMIRKRVCCYTRLDMLSSTRCVGDVSSELRRQKNIEKRLGRDAKKGTIA